MPLADREELAEEENLSSLENSVVKAKAKVRKDAAIASAAAAAPAAVACDASLVAANDDAVAINASDIPLEPALKVAAVSDPDEALARALQDEEDREFSKDVLSQIHRTEARAWPTQQTIDKVIEESKRIK